MLLLKNGRILDPSRSLDDVLDLLVDGGRIVRIGRNLSAAGGSLLDVTGMVVAPGFIDMHVHLREPGFEQSETIRTGTQAAAAGGFTAVACMPNTKPVNHSVTTTEFILKKAAAEAAVDVYPISAVTVDQDGRDLVEMEALKQAGTVAFSDDGHPVADSLIMRKALERAGKIGLPVIDHCEDPALFRGGTINEGAVSAALALQGIPGAAEEIMVARNIILARLTGSHVHLAHMSTAGSMELIRQARREGIPVTAEVTPHHFTLTEEAVLSQGTNAKMNPPLRTPSDVEAVLEAIEDGTVDVIASDHAPHHPDKKNVPIQQAAFGVVGLETSVSLGLDRLVNTGLITPARFIELYSLRPATILGLRRGIAEGEEANLTVYHPVREIRIDAAMFKSKSKNTPFNGWTLRGCPIATICRGRIAWLSAECRVRSAE